MTTTTIDIIKIFVIGILSFLFAFALTPTLTHVLYKNKLWKKKVKEKAIDGGDISYFRKFHSEGEVNVPRLGGVLIWLSVVIITIFFFFLSSFSDNFWLSKFNFLSREQTWLLLFTLFFGSLIGLLDDLLQVLDLPSSFFQKIKKSIGEGLSLRYRLILIAIIGFIGAWWFYFRLGRETVFIPGIGDFYLGLFFIPFFVLVMVAVYSGSVIDGIDGLSGGTFASIFTAYAMIALFQGQINIATFCFAVLGSTLAFLWFNIPPARFYMGESGIIGLTTTLTVIAFLTNAVAVLPIIAILLFASSGSVIIQLLSKKYRHKKVFLAAPIHHHFEAKGWPSYKVTMRFWVIGIVAAFFGVVIHLLS
jgi:phospho-N-acetylmuramoyl-pentapeptide-transferase